MNILFLMTVLGAIGVMFLIIIDYMRHIAKLSFKRIAAIMVPVWIIWAIITYIAITY